MRFSLIIAALLPALQPATAQIYTNIKCVFPGQDVTGTWTNDHGITCTYRDTVGKNWGSKTDFAYMGRCGNGYTRLPRGNPYTQDCLEWAMCAYFDGQENCTREVKTMTDDWIIGVDFSCGAKNPPLGPLEPPTGRPVCHRTGSGHDKRRADVQREAQREALREAQTDPETET
ncbi:hypothetical protein GGR56DRAFT_644508 [Xylariaceae sp. FL0804]|nr:hypothetical protein GGR56DRAFT_644508 [Xylariaceae sp. FL0804]